MKLLLFASIDGVSDAFCESRKTFRISLTCVICYSSVMFFKNIGNQVCCCSHIGCARILGRDGSNLFNVEVFVLF